MEQQVNFRLPTYLNRRSFTFNPNMGDLVSQDINVVALVKGEERYIFLFKDSQTSETLRTLGRYASDPKLSFSWYDAAVLSQKVRNTKTAPSVKEEKVGWNVKSSRLNSHSVKDSGSNDDR